MVYAMISKKIPNTEDGSRLDRCIRRLLGNINQAILEKLLRFFFFVIKTKQKKHSNFPFLWVFLTLCTNYLEFYMFINIGRRKQFSGRRNLDKSS